MEVFRQTERRSVRAGRSTMLDGNSNERRATRRVVQRRRNSLSSVARLFIFYARDKKINIGSFFFSLWLFIDNLSNGSIDDEILLLRALSELDGIVLRDSRCRSETSLLAALRTSRFVIQRHDGRTVSQRKVLAIRRNVTENWREFIKTKRDFTRCSVNKENLSRWVIICIEMRIKVRLRGSCRADHNN